jgi:ketosteroid isomerase-like protein
MRRLLGLTLAGCFAAGSFVFFAAAAQAADGPSAAEAKEQVMNTLHDWVRAENEHDAAALERILDDQFITTSGAGKPGNKEGFIKSLTAGKADPRQSQSLTDESVVVDGDTAVVVGTDTFHRTDGAKPDGLALRYTITFIRRNARWTALAEHIVEIPR